MKKALLATAALAMVTAPVLAQDGPFKDVPNDHWAYQAIDRLAQLKIILGDPDGQFHGKRTLTRYEMAVMLARMLDILDQRYVRQPLPDMSGFATKAELATKADKGHTHEGGGDGGDHSNFATKGDLAGLVKKSDVDLIRKMVAELQPELTTLGVDVDAVKKRLTSVENRVTKLEDDFKKRLKISGGFNTNVRSNFQGNTATTFLDKDGFEVGNSKSALADTSATHDLDLNLKATPNDNTLFEANLTMGNYLPYLTGVRSVAPKTKTIGGTVLNQDQATTLWSAYFATGTNLPLLGSTGVTVGRIPTKFGAYMLQLIDPDSYFTNGKTDSGAVPTDGLRANFRLGGINVTTQAGKVNPISYGPGSVSLSPGIMAGAFRTNYVGGLTRANTTGVLSNGGRQGSIAVGQFAAANANFNVNILTKLNINATYLTFGGTAQAAAGPASFDTVNVLGADVSGRIAGLTLTGHYAKSDTLRSTTKITNKQNEALDINAQAGRGNLLLSAGVRNVGPFFAAPGAWARVGSFQNPTDIQGSYGKVSYLVNPRIELMGSVQNYQGTGKVAAGLTKADKIANALIGVKVQVTGASAVEVSSETTDYTRTGSAGKPRELFTNIGYRFDFNTASAFRLQYQVADYKSNGNAAFNGAAPTSQQGGVVSGQFSVKF